MKVDGTRPRLLAGLLTDRLASFPVVAVVGPRQCGKTTLVRTLPAAERRLYRSLDDPLVLDMAVRDPETLLAEGDALTLDEIQRRPELLLRVKRLVDEGRKPGRFLLTGSANLLLMRHVADSLAGRAVYLTLRPMTESEKAGAPKPGPWTALLRATSAAQAARTLGAPKRTGWSWSRAVTEGGFPVPALDADASRRHAWFEGYEATYIERDLRQLAQIDALTDFRRLMRIAALRVGRLCNQADLARDAALSHATAHRYLNLLETSYVIDRVYPYSVSRTKRLIKTPKIYWTDVGLAVHLAGAPSEKDVRGHECAGGWLENLVWHHLRCWADASGQRVEILIWRTSAGEEVDFVIEAGKRLLPIEVKASASLRSSDADGLSTFLAEYGAAAPFGILLYGGTEVRFPAKNVLAVPLAVAMA
ncbi:MAG: ATP-binding protein [Planctomycetes bacterium]|nr:ATP-binding protein [Planctomycetota bacterium]